jgi:UV DNA damage endonuclease
MALPSNFNIGYCCINTKLRKDGIFTSRTLRLSTAKAKGISYIKSLVLQNLYDLYIILKWNVKHDILLFRMSSEMFPFITHTDFDYNLDFVDDFLKEIGNYAKKHCIRLTMHQCHFSVLNSTRQSVIENSIKDLAHHCDILDRMRLDKNSIIVIHGGCKDRISELRDTLINLPEYIRNRLVLENCELAYTVQDLLPLSEELQIPIVIDFHHGEINPSTESDDFYFKRVFTVWKNRHIKPKCHVSNSEINILKTDNITKRRKHSDLIRFFHVPLLKITENIDVMLECKLKEQSIYLLRNNTSFINEKN